MNFLALATILVFLALLAFVVLWLIYAQFSFAPWVPSNSRMSHQAFELIKPRPGQRFADLGCGDGRIVFMAYRRYRLTSFGYEISPLPYALAKLRQLLYIGKPITIKRESLFSVDCSQFEIIFLYGLPRTINEKLMPKLEREVKPGTYIISYNFSIIGRRPIAEFHQRWRNLYVYRF